MKQCMKVCNELKKELDNRTSLAHIKKADEECLARLRVKCDRAALEERRKNRGKKRKAPEEEESDFEDEFALYD